MQNAQIIQAYFLTLGLVDEFALAWIMTLYDEDVRASEYSPRGI